MPVGGAWLVFAASLKPMEQYFHSDVCDFIEEESLVIGDVVRRLLAFNIGL